MLHLYNSTTAHLSDYAYDGHMMCYRIENSMFYILRIHNICTNAECVNNYINKGIYRSLCCKFLTSNVNQHTSSLHPNSAPSTRSLCCGKKHYCSEVFFSSGFTNIAANKDCFHSNHSLDRVKNGVTGRKKLV